tara:strand:+ start:914 stop:1984 length:1071 start_codon:yes stop_codon:yes gene_type:complete
MHRRRSGSTYSADSLAAELLGEALDHKEAYERRTDREATKYCLGAMQEVDPKYTRISKDEAERVGSQLQIALQTKNIPIELELQGSVPLNVHIRGTSDVDLLALHRSFLTYDPNGSRRYSAAERTTKSYMQELRKESETILSQRYWSADVDTTGAKSIKLSGGSLARKIDVVPSYWHDTVDYQLYGLQEDRDVCIWDNVAQVPINNKPFKHMAMIDRKDREVNGGARKLIRFLKTVKRDMEKDDREVALSSYDIAALMWHCDGGLLQHTIVEELSLIANCDQYLEYLANNLNLARQLTTPDGSRTILEDEDKVLSLRELSSEVSELATDVAMEAQRISIPTADWRRSVLKETQIGA